MAWRPAQTLAQSGAASIEFALVAIPLMLVGLGGIEIAHWFNVRQTLSLALLEAARAASVAHAKPETIESAFEHALLPLFAGSYYGQAQQRLARALEQRQQDIQDSPWRIVIHSPNAAAYTDHAQEKISIHGLPTISNDYQQEQDQHYRRTGWTDGKGPVSQQDIFQANTLHLTLSYPHKPALPGVSGLLKQIHPTADSYARAVMHRGYLPMTRSLTLTMQSHPVDWPSLVNGKVIHAHRQAAYPTAAHKRDTGAGCAGAWCPRPWNGSGLEATDSVSNGPGSTRNSSGQTSNDIAKDGRPISADIDLDAPRSSDDSVLSLADADHLNRENDGDPCAVTLCCD